MIVAGLLGVGGIGILGISVLCPLLAYPIYCFQNKAVRRRTNVAEAAQSSPTSIEIIIPAHNEEEHLGVTLRSIENAIHFLESSQAVSSGPTFSVHVGADGCSDNTVEVAQTFQNVIVTASPNRKSKWRTIKQLVSASASDWVILVDAGTVWPETFLAEFMERITAEPKAIAVAPSYQPLRGGWLTKIIWAVERLLKRMESFSGGPISLHGATVGYKTEPLKGVMSYLDDTQWLNDDVVIPLSLRGLYPEGIILYPAAEVSDAGAMPGRLDLRRRDRMLLGNLQWARSLLWPSFRMNPVAGIVASRRLFRVFWAYWFGCAALGLLVAYPSYLWPILFGLALLAAFSGNFRQLAGAAWVSFQAPLRFTQQNSQWEGSWK